MICFSILSACNNILVTYNLWRQEAKRHFGICICWTTFLFSNLANLKQHNKQHATFGLLRTIFSWDVQHLTADLLSVRSQLWLCQTASWDTSHLYFSMVTRIPACSFQRDMVYSSRDSSPTRRLNTLPSSTSSSSPSRSRLSYSGGRPPSFTGSQHEQPRQPHHAPAGQGPNAGLSPSPSAILERRDVKPDEEVSAKNMALMKNESLYADPYSLMHEGRLSIASTQSLAAIGDPFSFPVTSGLYRRGSVRSLSTYSAAADLEDSLYKPGGSLYSDTYSSATLGMGFRMPPSSPQKIPDMQMRDRDSYSNPPSRASPVRQSFRKDSASSSVFIESPKSRPSSGSEPLCLTAGPGEGGRATPGFGSLSGQDLETSRSVLSEWRI